MAQPFALPRSGVWLVRSKSDRSWKLRGQYFTSDWWDPPASGWPPEAVEAVAQLKAARGVDPPADLTCVYLPYPRGKLKRLFESCVLITTERQGALHCLTQENGLTILSVDRDRGEIEFAKPGQDPVHCYSAQAMGILDEANGHWHWAWAAEATGALNPHALSSARMLHEYGLKHDIPELTYEEIALGLDGDRPWFNTSYLARIACHLSDSDFTIAGGTSETPTWKEIWLVKAPGALAQPANVAIRVFYVIKEALETWGPDLQATQARKAIAAYAQQRGCKVTDFAGRKLDWAPEDRQVVERRIQIEDPAGECIYVDFDEFGAICGMAHPPPTQKPVEKPAQKSWLKRMFGSRTQIGD
jgi:hypothetical protein